MDLDLGGVLYRRVNPRVDPVDPAFLFGSCEELMLKKELVEVVELVGDINELRRLLLLVLSVEIPRVFLLYNSCAVVVVVMQELVLVGLIFNFLIVFNDIGLIR